MSRTRLRVVAVSFLLVSLVVAGCSGEDDPDEQRQQGQEAQDTAAGAMLSGRWPLTGLPAAGAPPKHPVMVVKIDNTSSASPQAGLSQADLVAEELVEGGSTRLAAFYHSQLPRRVGPVRSFRATDIGIVAPADAVLVGSGGAAQTVRRLQRAGIRTQTEGAAGFYRESGRQAPYDLFMKLPRLAKTLKSQGSPDGYFPWGSEAGFPSGRRATGLTAQFSPAHTTSWAYRDRKYVNLGSRAADNDEFRPETVLVLRVQLGDAGYLDPAGNPVPETRLTGKGELLAFHGGRVVRGTWRKPGLDASLALRAKGKELTLPPGKVWMELVPSSGGAVTVTR